MRIYISAFGNCVLNCITYYKVARVLLKFSQRKVARRNSLKISAPLPLNEGQGHSCLKYCKGELFLFSYIGRPYEQEVLLVPGICKTGGNFKRVIQ